MQVRMKPDGTEFAVFTGNNEEPQPFVHLKLFGGPATVFNQAQRMRLAIVLRELALHFDPDITVPR